MRRWAVADLHWYHQDEAGSLTWLGGGVLAEGVAVKEAVQILANAFRDLPTPAADYWERRRQMDAGQLRPNHWRAGGKSGAIPTPDLTTPVRIIFAADVRDRHLTGRAV